MRLLRTYYEDTFFFIARELTPYPMRVEVTVAYDLISPKNQFADALFNHEILTLFTEYGENVISSYMRKQAFRREVDRECQLNHYRKGF